MISERVGERSAPKTKGKQTYTPPGKKGRTVKGIYWKDNREELRENGYADQKDRKILKKNRHDQRQGIILRGKLRKGI